MRTTAYVLWSSRDVFVAVGAEVQHATLPPGDPIPAVVKAIQQWAPSARRVRIGYHIPELRVLAVECAKGDRAVLRATLGEEHSVLLNPLTRWAASRIHSDATGSSTLLWIDPTNYLHRLRAALENIAVTLDGVWPLADLMAEATATGTTKARLVTLIGSSSGLLFTSTNTGGRTAAWTKQPEVHEEMDKLVRTAVTHFDPADPPEVSLLDAGAEPWDLTQSAIADFNIQPLEMSALFDALDRMLPSGISNFCPPPRLNYVAIGLVAAAAIIALAGLVNGGLYVRDVVRMNSDSTARAAAIRELRASNDHLVENRRTIQALRDFEAELGCERARRLRLVELVAVNKPREITIRAIRIVENRFEIDGTAHEGVGKSSGPIYVFLDRLTSGGAKLQFDADARPAALTSAEFTLKGRWQ